MQWKIKEEDLIARKESKNSKLNSKRIKIASFDDIKYYLTIHPSRIDDDGEPTTWLYFNIEMENDKKTIETVCDFSVDSVNYSEVVQGNFAESARDGLILCSTNDLFDPKKGYIVDGFLTINFNGILMMEKDQATILDCENRVALKEDDVTKQEKDFTIVIGDNETKVAFKKISSPISMQWKVKEEDLKAKKELGNEYLDSTIIKSFSDVGYSLSIELNKFQNSDQLKTFLFLNIEMENEKKIKAICIFSIDSVNSYRGIQHVFEKSKGLGYALCSTNDLFDPSKGYIVDGYLTINCNGILMIEKDKISGDNKINVHKQVLMDASPVFSAMIESGMKESIENKMIIPDFSFEVVDAAIKLCYTSNVPQDLNLDDMLSLYQFGDKYQIKIITDLVENYLIKNLLPSNVVEIIQFSNFLSIKKLFQQCTNFLIKCSKESTAVLGLESLDKNLLASTFLNSFCSELCDVEESEDENSDAESFDFGDSDSANSDDDDDDDDDD
uniref:BTB domain-containing protein n=1 Tax=Panagrolaimus sp. ES5 TaxID=591445 RepID=A0AC34FK38_9BILA